MKEIKAYVRTGFINKVVDALQDAGAPGITVVEVHPVGYGFEPNYFSTAKQEYKRWPEITKVEVVCEESQVDTLVSAIAEATHTGAKGDGVIFVSPVEQAIRIRDRATGTQAL